MKLALIRRGYSPSGGAERYLLRFAEALREAGHEAMLYGSREWPAYVWKGEMVRAEGNSPRDFADRIAKARPREHCDLVYSLERVWECDAYRAGDGVHKVWLERRRAFEAPWKGWIRGMQGKHREILELERALFDPGAKRVIIANSRMAAGEIARNFRVAEERLRVIYNGLPGSAFEGAPAEAVRSGKEAPRVLFAGSGWERKGLRFAIEAINRTERATLLVAGAGKRRGLPASRRTRYLGEVKEMRGLMEQADVFVLPTLYDPFSNASLEAMAAGLPVITTEANGFAEVMRPGEDGEVLKGPADVEGMARAIEKWCAIDTPAKRAARRMEAARYTIERNVRETLAALSL